MAKSALHFKKSLFTGLILAFGLTSAVPVLGEKLSVKQLLERAQTDAERQAVESLIDKLQTDPKPAQTTTERSRPPLRSGEQKTQTTLEPDKTTRAPQQSDKAKPEKSGESKGIWSIFTGWGQNKQKAPEPTLTTNPRTKPDGPQTARQPAVQVPASRQQKPGKQASIPQPAKTSTAVRPVATNSKKSGSNRPRTIVGTRPSSSSLEQAVLLADQNQLASADIEVTFDFDSNEISPRAVSALKVMGNAFADKRLATQKFLIAGHTDAKGRKSYNKDLSQKRATSIRTFLIKSFGISKDRLIAKGFGEQYLKNQLQPRAPANRRVQIINLKNSRLATGR